MAVPKRKTSKARRNKRRTHWKLAVPGLVSCPQCHEAKLPHHVCVHCGYYKGKEVLETE
ncbi:MAG: 50S ribosomal protein L32 [Firmicutes bacterium]|nr:50S ribosomal protein L32 [Bacillota bacterium]